MAERDKEEGLGIGEGSICSTTLIYLLEKFNIKDGEGCYNGGNLMGPANG
jgi:hypothetical protein